MESLIIYQYLGQEGCSMRSVFFFSYLLSTGITAKCLLLLAAVDLIALVCINVIAKLNHFVIRFQTNNSSHICFHFYVVLP